MLHVLSRPTGFIFFLFLFHFLDTNFTVLCVLPLWVTNFSFLYKTGSCGISKAFSIQKMSIRYKCHQCGWSDIGPFFLINMCIYLLYLVKGGKKNSVKDWILVVDLCFFIFHIIILFNKYVDLFSILWIYVILLYNVWYFFFSKKNLIIIIFLFKFLSTHKELFPTYNELLPIHDRTFTSTLQKFIYIY